MNRREFSLVTAMAGALAKPGRSEPAARIPEAAGLITESVFLDDCVRIAMYDPGVSPAAKKALTSQGDFVRNGALFPGSSPPKTEEEFALHAGKICSASLMRHRKPNTPEARLYQDVAVMRDMSLKDGCDPSKPVPVADLFDLLHTRRRLGLHTLNPDDDIQKWLEGVVTWWREQHDLRAALAAAYTNPKPAADFYNPADPLIRLARNFQVGEVAPADALAPAMNLARAGSGYARALADSIEGIKKLPRLS